MSTRLALPAWCAILAISLALGCPGLESPRPLGSASVAHAREQASVGTLREL
jgi:hypothetical protein